MARTKAPTMAPTPASTMGDTVWLSYAELSERIGITPESARNLVRRKRWPRRPGNDGAQRIGVPADYLDDRTPIDAPTSGDTDAPTNPPIDGDTDGPTIAAMEAHIATLREMVAQAEETATHERLRADAERDRANVEAGRANGERDRADQAHVRADKIANELHDLAERFAGSIEDARTRESTLAEKLEAVRIEMAALRARPWWRRLAG